jgi:diguanylate cyclase (GGDEF)-like protein
MFRPVLPDSPVPPSSSVAASELTMSVSEGLAEVLGDFARTMLTDFPIQGILDHLVKRIVEILPITAAGVTVISPGLHPQYVAASNPAALRFEQLQTELGEGPCLVAYDTGKAIAVPDLGSEVLFPTFTRRALEAGLRAVFTFPLHHGDTQLGALDLYRETPGALSQESMSAAQTLADVAGAYLLNAQARADLKDSSDRAHEAALHDALTGLPNRTLMLERLEHAFLRARRSSKTSAVFFVDLDRFKAINDTYGHSAGDELLVAAAERLTEVLRPGDTLARLAGDEFVILCEDLDSQVAADAITVRIDAALALPFVLSGVGVNVTASIGIAFSGEGNDGPEQLLHEADLAMYRTKRERLGGREFLSLRDEHAAKQLAELEAALPGAAQRGELALAYQPIVAAGNGRLTGVEALLRWQHPTFGAVTPTVLIPLAEQCGQIIELGRWVLEQAWSDCRDWQDDASSELGVSVNVSAHQLMSAGFTDTVAGVIDGTASNPGLLTLEVTENVFVRDGERALFVLNDLKDMGVTLALDDFGTGYSSLGYLRRFPVDTVKVDREFVANLGHDVPSHIIVTAVIALAHDLGLTVVSEGVETADQHLELTRLGSDSCQGFYFARPMPYTKLRDLVQRLAEVSARGALTAPRTGAAPTEPALRT